MKPKGKIVMISTPPNSNIHPAWVEAMKEEHDKKVFNAIMNGYWCDEYDTIAPCYDDDADQDGMITSYEIEKTL